MRFHAFLVRSIGLIVIVSSVLAGQSRQKIVPQVLPVTSAQLRELIRQDSGNTVLVNAWATWCKPCKEELPALLKLAENYEKRNFKLILISGDDVEDLESVVQPALQKTGVAFPTYIMNDSTQEAFISTMNPAWEGAFALPTSCLYDTKGKLADMFVGQRTYRQFVKLLVPHLKK